MTLGDNNARVALNNNQDVAIIKQGFNQGLNYPDDLDKLIWFYHNFKDICFIKDAIAIWEQQTAWDD